MNGKEAHACLSLQADTLGTVCHNYSGVLYKLCSVFVMDFDVFESSAAAVLRASPGLQIEIWQDVEKEMLLMCNVPVTLNCMDENTVGRVSIS